MTSAAALLREFHSIGIELRPLGDLIAFRPKAAMTPALLKRLREHKVELLALLSDSPAVQQPPVEPELGPFVAEVLSIFRGSELVPDSEPLWGSAPILAPGVPEPCWACTGSQRWRLREGCTWVCPTCHPPQLLVDQLEWLQPDAENGGGAR